MLNGPARSPPGPVNGCSESVPNAIAMPSVRRWIAFVLIADVKEMNMDNRITVDTYEAPEVLGSFTAQDVLGTADGQMGGGSVIYAA